jgi:hypothetical protein
MPKQPQQQIPIRQSTRGRGGGGGVGLASGAVSDFIKDQNMAQRKMMQNFSKIQEMQAMEASQNAAQMTQAMNRVVATEDEKKVREESLKEKTGDREYQEKYAKWTTEFQANAVKDMQATQTRVNSQMASARNFIQRMDANRVEFGDRIRGMRAMLMDPDRIDRWMNIPGGSERLEEAHNKLRQAEVFHEQDHQSPYTAEAAQIMTQVEEDVRAGRPHTDLTKLLGVKPKELMSFSAEEQEELFHSGGYPPGGLYGRDPGDSSIKKYDNFNPVDYMSNMWMMEDEQFFATFTHKKFQQEYVVMKMEGIKEMREELTKLQEFSTKDYDRLADTVVEGAYYGAAQFANDISEGRISPGNLSGSLVLKSGEFASPDVSNAMATKLLESVFTSISGPGSEAILSDLNSLLEGEGEKGLLDVDVEMYKAFNMRNILRHLGERLEDMMKAPDTKGMDPMSMRIAKNIANMPESNQKTQLLRSLVMVPGDIERGKLLEPIVTRKGGIKVSGTLLGQIHRGVNRMFRLSKQKASDLIGLIEAQPIMQGYSMKQGASLRYIDALVGSYMSGKEGPEPDEAMRQKAMKGATAEQQLQALEDVGEGAPDEFDIKTETLREAVMLSPFQAAGQLYSGLTTHSEFLAAIYSGDYDLVPLEMPPVSAANLGEAQLALDNYIGASKRRRGRVTAEMRQRREEHEKKTKTKTSTPGETKGGAATPGGGQDEPNAPMARPGV